MRYFLLFFPVLIFSCNQNSGSSTNSTEEKSDFDIFYEKFHSDSLYQIEHITFPLKGLPANADSITIASGNFRWTKDEWKIHKPIDLDDGSEFIRKVKIFDNTLVEEKFYHKTGIAVFVRRFSKFDGEWFLIYYAGLNPVSK